MSVKGAETVGLRRVVRDSYGDATLSDTLVTFTRCVVIPRTVGEDNDQGSLTIAGHQVYVPPQRPTWSAEVAVEDQKVKDSDQLFVRGEWTDIDGHPADYVDLKGKPKGLLITTRGEVLA